MKDNQGRPFLILLTTVIILAIISLIPLSEISGGALKDYNLVGDLFPSEKPVVTNANTYIDPDLLALSENDIHDEAIVSDSTSPVETDESQSVTFEDIEFHSDGKIEDYSAGKNGLSKLKSALSNGKLARIAMLGDSYIEGDILSQDIRNLLQNKYGGRGAGYVPVSSNMTGFRRSIRQTCSGWIEHDFRNTGKHHKLLSGFYFTPDGSATTTIKGSKKTTPSSSWCNSTLLYIAPEATTIKIRVGNNEQQTFDVTPSEEVQAIVIGGETDEISISVNSSKFVALGLYIDDNKGIALDNMSIRGYSGIRHDSLDPELAMQMRKYIDYDLIILEYGINALSSAQVNYSSYTTALEKSINRIKECYPNAEILMMGIGDRGEKDGADVKSMSTVPAMINAQRSLAKKLGLMFWDIREAMGGENAVVEWVNNRDINKDYIHLSFQGGARMGKLFVDALNEKLDN